MGIKDAQAGEKLEAWKNPSNFLPFLFRTNITSYNQRQARKQCLRALRIFFCSCDRLRPPVGYREIIATHPPLPIIPVTHIRFLLLPHTSPLVSRPALPTTHSLRALAPPQSPPSRRFNQFFASRTEHRPSIRPIPLPPLPAKTTPPTHTPPCALHPFP